MFDLGLPRDVDEVLNYVRAMNHGLARLSELPVSVRLIREIQAQLLEAFAEAGCSPASCVPARTGSAR